MLWRNLCAFTLTVEAIVGPFWTASTGGKVEKLLATARANGVTVIYTLFPSPAPDRFPNPVIGDVIPAIAPKGDEPVVISFVDKFMLGDRDTGLQRMLKDKRSQPSCWLVPRRIMAFSSRQSRPPCVALTWSYRWMKYREITAMRTSWQVTL
jgi:hypothetical protein